MVLENVIAKNIEFNTPLWIASIHLRKAFDRIQYGPLLQTLREQNIPDPYVALMSELYRDQWGYVRGGSYFQIQRGVKQGDVISPMLFNAGLEKAMRSWKQRLTNHGILVSANSPRLTNTRYADDIMLYGKSLSEVQTMISWLIEELQIVGLQVNTSK